MESSKVAEQMGLTVSGTESDLDKSSGVRRRYWRIDSIDTYIHQMNDGDSISDCPCSLCVSFLRKSRQRVSTARSLSMEAEKSRKLSMMNSSLGEKTH